MMENELTTLLKKLVAIPSISPDDAGCQDYLIERLEKCGFNITKFPAGKVSNFWAEHGDGDTCFAFAGHTDVVPVGEVASWDTPPFQPTIKENVLYGRGAADMKSGLAAMVLACERFVKDNPNHPGRIGLLITSGEDGDHYNDGTPVVMKELKQLRRHIDYCVIGEPSSHAKVGDVVRVGRRGSLNVDLKVIGKQGHVAYPEQVINPNHLLGKLITALCEEKWDDGNEFFPATSMQITNIQAGTGASNVVPESAAITFNFRFSSELDADTLEQRVRDIVAKHCEQHELTFTLSGNPFLTQHGKLTKAVTTSIEAIVGYTPELSTSGGTSDGRFIAPYGVEVVELGPVNATIHKVNECVDLQELTQLFRIYCHIVDEILK